MQSLPALIPKPPSKAWRIADIRLVNDQQLQFRFEHSDTGDWLEVDLLPSDAPGQVLRRLANCSVRYRGEIKQPTPQLTREAGALVIGLAESIDAQLSSLGATATFGDAIGARRRAEGMVFSRDSLREMLAPELVQGAPLPGGFELVGIYPASHVQDSSSATLELALEFRQDERRLLATVGPKRPGHKGFAETTHFSIGYLTFGAAQPPGTQELLQQLAITLRLRDHEQLEVEFPDVSSDVKLPVLREHNAAALEGDAESNGILNLAISTDCGQQCQFCSVKQVAPPTADSDPLLARYLADLRESRKKGTTHVRINGYDPLAYPRILEVLRFARSEGYTEVSIFSPSTRLADETFCAELVRLLPERRQFYVPLYSTSARTHDHIVGRPGAHTAVSSSLDLLDRLAGRDSITILTAVTREGLPHLNGVREFARNRGYAFAAHMPYPTTEGQTDRYFEAAPRMTDVAAHFAQLLTPGSQHVPFYVRGVAPCVTLRVLGSRGIALDQWLVVDARMAGAPGSEYRSSEFRHGAGDRDAQAFSATTMPCPHAEKCSLHEACGGELLRAYVEAFGVDEIAAVSLRELLLSTNPNPVLDPGAQLARQALDHALLSAGTGANALQLLSIKAGDRALQLSVLTADQQRLEVLWSERQPDDAPSDAARCGTFYAAEAITETLQDTSEASAATLQRFLRALADAVPHAPLPRLRPARANAHAERLEVEELLPALRAGVEQHLHASSDAVGAAWSLLEARTYEYDRWEAELRLVSTDGRRLSFLVHPNSDEASVFARTQHFEVSYHSEDMTEAQHAALYARDAATIDAFVGWLRSWESSSHSSAERAG